jgi:hypothetical protein
MDDEYAVEYAPDGLHYFTLKRGRVSEMWDYFVMGRDIREALMLCPQSKFRLRNVSSDKVIGVLKFDREKKEFLHLES